MNFSLASSRYTCNSYQNAWQKKWIKLYVSILYSVSPALSIWVNSDDRPSVQSLWHDAQYSYSETYICTYTTSWPASILFSSLVTQPPKTHVKKGFGNIVCNELTQTLECGATNQIASFAINMQSAQFIMKIIFTKNAAQMCHMVAFVSTRALWRLWAGKRHRVSPAITSPWY